MKKFDKILSWILVILCYAVGGLEIANAITSKDVSGNTSFIYFAIGTLYLRTLNHS
jgi:hypothetical protein